MPFRGDKKMKQDDFESLKEIEFRARKLKNRLDAGTYDNFPELEPALTSARETFAKLDVWLSEISYIAETELR